MHRARARKSGAHSVASSTGARREAVDVPVSSLMIRAPLHVPPDLEFDALDALLVARGVAVAPVLDEQKRVLGVVFASDVRRRVAARAKGDRGHDAATARDVARPSPVCVPESSPLSRAAAAMVDAVADEVAIVSGAGDVVGVLRAVDVLRWTYGGTMSTAPRPDVSAALATPRAMLRALASASSDTEAATRALAAICENDGWNVASLWWVAEAGDRISCETTWRAPGFEDLAFLRGRVSFRRGEGIPGKVWETGEPVWVASMPPGTRAEEGGVPFRSLCAHPIGAPERIDGLVELFSLAPKERSDVTLDTLGLLAAHLAATSARRVRPSRGSIPDADAGRLREIERLAALGSLAGGVAHEINNALTLVRLTLGRLVSLEKAQRPTTPLQEHRVEMLEDVREGFVRVERIGRELSVFASVDEDGSPRVPVDVSEVLTSVTHVVANELKHRARLAWNLGATRAVLARRARLEQVFFNVVLNAVQAIPEGNASENAIRVSSSDGPSGAVVVEVVDTGVGIREEDVERVFDSFFTTRPSRALGLGLAVARDVVGSLGGTIEVTRASEGRGTRVRVTLPGASNERAPASSSLPAPAEASSRLRVLVIDDDIPVGQAIGLALEPHDVTVVSSGRDALAKLTREPPFDVVLCDLMMPDLSGVDVFHEAVAAKPEVAEAFVFMTGGAFTPRAREFLAGVPNARLEKPFHAQALHDLLRDELAARGRRHALH